MTDNYSDYVDEFGQIAPLKASDDQRTPPPEGFFTGPEIGQRLPGFKLKNTAGKRIDLHQGRGKAKAVVVFFRSAGW